MGDFIRYKRFTEEFDNNDEIQKFLNTLSSDGWTIINYIEKPIDVKTLSIVIVAGKRNEII